MGGNSTPRAMDRRIITTLRHNKYHLLCFNVAKFLISVPPPLVSHAQGKKSSFFDLDRVFVPPLATPPPIIHLVSSRACAEASSAEPSPSAEASSAEPLPSTMPSPSAQASSAEPSSSAEASSTEASSAEPSPFLFQSSSFWALRLTSSFWAFFFRR